MRMAFVMSRAPLRLAPPLSQRKKLSSDPIHQKAAHIRTTALRVTNRAIAGQLKDLADEYQRRAEKASYVDAAKASAVGAEWDGPSDVGMPGTSARSRTFYSRVPACIASSPGVESLLRMMTVIAR